MKHWTVYVCIFLIIYTCLHVHGFARTFFANICVYSYKNVGMFKIHFLHVRVGFPSDNVNLRLLQGQGMTAKCGKTSQRMTRTLIFPDSIFFWIEVMEGHDEINAWRVSQIHFDSSELPYSPCSSMFRLRVPGICLQRRNNPSCIWRNQVLEIIPSKDSWIMKSLGRCLDHPTVGRRDCESGDLLVIPLNQQSVRERDFWVFSCLI